MLGDTSAYQRQMVAYAPTAAGWYGVSPDDLATELAETQITPPDTDFEDRMAPDLPGRRIDLHHAALVRLR